MLEIIAISLSLISWWGGYYYSEDSIRYREDKKWAKKEIDNANMMAIRFAIEGDKNKEEYWAAYHERLTDQWGNI